MGIVMVPPTDSQSSEERESAKRNQSTCCCSLSSSEPSNIPCGWIVHTFGVRRNCKAYLMRLPIDIGELPNGRCFGTLVLFGILFLVGHALRRVRCCRALYFCGLQIVCWVVGRGLGPTLSFFISRREMELLACFLPWKMLEVEMT